MPTTEQVAKRLAADSNWFVKTMIGGFLSLVPIVNFFALGYLYRVFVNGSLQREFELPEWNDWKALFIDGLKFFVIALIFAAVPIALMRALTEAIPGDSFLARIPLMPVIFFAPPLMSAALYLFTLGGDFKNCFNFGALRGMLLRSFVAYLGPTFGFLGVVLVGWVVLPFSFFIGGVIYFYLMGAVFNGLERTTRT